LHDFQGEYKYFKLEKIGKLIIFFCQSGII